MIRVQIKKQNIVTNEATFPTETEANTWLEFHKSNHTFGKPAVYETVETIVPALYEEQELLDENGLSYDPPQFETVEVAPESVEYTQKLVTPAEEFEVVITDVTVELNAQKNKQDKIEAGKKARVVCELVLDFIAGENLAKNLTSDQITEMQTIFSSIESALRAGRPNLAKIHITAIEVDGVLVSQEMKDTCLELLSNY